MEKALAFAQQRPRLAFWWGVGYRPGLFSHLCRITLDHEVHTALLATQEEKLDCCPWWGGLEHRAALVILRSSEAETGLLFLGPCRVNMLRQEAGECGNHQLASPRLSPHSSAF